MCVCACVREYVQSGYGVGTEYGLRVRLWPLDNVRGGLLLTTTHYRSLTTTYCSLTAAYLLLRTCFLPTH